MSTKKHRHYWSYQHAVWQGRKETEVGVVRYCDCGTTQMAFTSRWKKLNTKQYPDVKRSLKEEAAGFPL